MLLTVALSPHVQDAWSTLRTCAGCPGRTDVRCPMVHLSWPGCASRPIVGHRLCSPHVDGQLSPIYRLSSVRCSQKRAKGSHAKPLHPRNEGEQSCSLGCFAAVVHVPPRRIGVNSVLTANPSCAPPADGRCATRAWTGSLGCSIAAPGTTTPIVC